MNHRGVGAKLCSVSKSSIRTNLIQANPQARLDISVIIVSWNVRDLLVKCLEALLSDDVSGGMALQVIVVDNASSDGSEEAARAFPDVCAIQTGENLGYGKANNMGFAEAAGSYLLVLNPDTVPQPGSLRALLDFAEAHPLAGIMSPRLLNPNGTVQPSAFRFPTLLMAAIDLFGLPVVIPGRLRLKLFGSGLNGRYPQETKTKDPFRIDHPLGACMLIRREVYEQLGGFDPAIYMYSEEIELAMRASRAGWECWQVPEARVIHLGGQSTRQMPDRMYVELWRSRLYIYSTFRSKIAQLALRGLVAAAHLLNALGALWRLARGRIERTEARREWRRAGAIIRLVMGK